MGKTKSWEPYFRTMHAMHEVCRVDRNYAILSIAELRYARPSNKTGFLCFFVHFGFNMEFFIERVKLHPCLWKPNDMSYRDQTKKDLAWQRVARECDMINGQDAKSHWKKLRDSHREALRRRKTATGEPVQNMKPWKYEALMEFLVTQKESNETVLSYSIQDTSLDIPYTSDTNTNDDGLGTTSPPDSPLPSSSMYHRREKYRKLRRLERDEERMKMYDSNRQRDALTDLFSSLCQKTRELPKFLQVRVQREIFETINRAEEEALGYDIKTEVPD